MKTTPSASKIPPKNEAVSNPVFGHGGLVVPDVVVVTDVVMVVFVAISLVLKYEVELELVTFSLVLAAGVENVTGDWVVGSVPL